MSAPKGIDVRQSGGTILVRVGIDDPSGNALATGTATLRVLEWQADGTIKQLDFADNTLKTGTPTTPTMAMTARNLPDATVSGLWSAVLSTANVANFTVGGIYVVIVTHSALPGVTIRREWQYGAAEGDLLVKPAVTLAAADVSGNLPANAVQWGGAGVTGMPLPTSSYTAPPPPSVIAASILATPSNLLVTDSTGKVGANNLPSDYQQRGQPVTLPTTAPSGYGGTGATPAQLAAAILATPGNLIATDSTGKVGANNLPTDYQQRGVAVTLPTTVPAGYGGTGATPAQLAAAILATPSNLLVTDSTGKVGTNNLPTDYQQRGVAVTLPTTVPAGYGGTGATPAQLAAAILATPSNLLVTDSTGKVGTNNLPTDYQQRGVAVTLPTTVPAGYGGTGATPAQLAAAILATPSNLLVTDSTGKVGANNLPSDYQQRGQPVTLPTTAPSGYGGTGATPAQLAAAILATPGNLIATDSTGKVGANNLPTDYQQRGVAVTLPTTVPAGYGGTGATPAQLAAAILATPSNLLVTDSTGKVGANNLPSDYQQRGQPVTLPTTAPSGYGGTGATPAQLAAAILATPANKITTDATGAVSMSLTQSIPLSNTPQTVGDALNAARAQGFGKWIFDPTGKTLKLFAPDGATVVRSFTLDNATNPSTRT